MKNVETWKRGNVETWKRGNVETQKSELNQLKKNDSLLDIVREIGAGNETRTRDPNLGKVVLYQLSYSRIGGIKKIWSGKRDSNSRPQPWQGCALPTELFPQNLVLHD